MRYSLIQDLENTKKIWYKVEDDTNNTRTGTPTALTLYDQGLATTIGILENITTIDYLFRYIEKVGKKTKLEEKSCVKHFAF